MEGAGGYGGLASSQWESSVPPGQGVWERGRSLPWQKKSSEGEEGAQGREPRCGGGEEGPPWGRGSSWQKRTG